MSLDVETLGRLLAFAALVAATEFYAVVIGRRASRRRAQEREADRDAEMPAALPVAPARRAFGIESDQHPSSKWIARWRAMSGSETQSSASPPAEDDESGSRMRED